MRGKSIDLSGSKFGRLLVLEKGTNTKHGNFRWKCLCDCGNIKYVATGSLNNGKSQSCGCLHFEKVFRGYKELSQTYFYRLQEGAKKRNLEFSITIEDCWNQFLKQNRKCALTGIELTVVTDYTAKHDLQDASLDRIDSTKGYIKDNIQWTHKYINIMKQDMQDDEFIGWCEKVVNYAKNNLSNTETISKTANLAA